MTVELTYVINDIWFPDVLNSTKFITINLFFVFKLLVIVLDGFPVFFLLNVT